MLTNKSLTSQVNYKNSINFLYKQISINIYYIILKLIPYNNQENLLQYIEQQVINNGTKINELLLNYLKIYTSKQLDELIDELSFYEKTLYENNKFEINNTVLTEYTDEQINSLQMLIYNKLSINEYKKDIFTLFNKHLHVTKEINKCILNNVIKPILKDLVEDYQSIAAVCNLQYEYKSQEYYSLFITQLILCEYPLTEEQLDILTGGINIDIISQHLRQEVSNNAGSLQNKFKIDDNWKHLNEATRKLYLNRHEYTTVYIFSQLKDEHYIVLLPKIIKSICTDFKNIAPNKKTKTLKEYISSIYDYISNNKYNVLSTIILLLGTCTIYNQYNKYNMLKKAFLNSEKENKSQDDIIIKLARKETGYKKEIAQLNKTTDYLLNKNNLLEKRERGITKILTNLYIDHDELIKSNRDIKNNLDCILKK